MKWLMQNLYNQLRLLKYLVLGFIDINSYFKYQTTLKGKASLIKVNGRKVHVRKGTPDLRVAVSCFTGEFDCLRHLLPRDYNGVIVDAGGYIGTATIALHELFPKAQFVVVEPSEENIKMLRKNLSDTPNLKVFHGALVGKNTDSVTLRNRGTGEWGFTSVTNPADKVGAAVLHSTTAFVLSDLVPSIDEIGILKLDIEGGEFDVFENDAEALGSIKAIFVELHDRIVEGCTASFFNFSTHRYVVKMAGEKFLSLRVEK